MLPNRSPTEKPLVYIYTSATLFSSPPFQHAGRKKTVAFCLGQMPSIRSRGCICGLAMRELRTPWRDMCMRSSFGTRITRCIKKPRVALVDFGFDGGRRQRGGGGMKLVLHRIARIMYETVIENSRRLFFFRFL